LELLKRIMELAENNVAVDYTIVDQKLNGITDGSMPDKTYTITISKYDSYSGELILSQAFDDLEEGLLWGIATGESYLKQTR